jgi:hypothetical protein
LSFALAFVLLSAGAQSNHGRVITLVSRKNIVAFSGFWHFSARAQETGCPLAGSQRVELTLPQGFCGKVASNA